MNEKAVLLSIQPKWCGLIASGKKTIEVRKTRPKIETPFKCYIYQSRDKGRLLDVLKDGDENYGEIYHGKPVFIKGIDRDVNSCLFGREQKIIGEFVCDEIIDVDCDSIAPFDKSSGGYVDKQCCWLSRKELWKYTGGYCAYGWHISGLIIYDQPKALSEFNIVDNAAVLSCIHREIAGQPEYKTAHNGWIKGGYICHAGSEPDWCTKCRTKPLERPPQSWRYVEVPKIKNGDKVVMNDNYVVNEEDKGKVWTVRSDPWECCGTIVVLLEGKSGGYAVDGLGVVSGKEDIE